jgi:hypothetical protein
LGVPFELGHPRKLAEDVHLLDRLEAGLVESVPQETLGHWKALRHPARLGELDEGLGSDWSGLRGADHFLEEDCRLLHVARIARVLGGGDAASIDALDRV